MGTKLSKSPLERRNTVARRSQRRSIHTIKSKVNKVIQDIKKFKGTEEDDNFRGLLTELEHLKHVLLIKTQDLQPQLATVYDNTLSLIDEAVQALGDKLVENQAKAKKKDEESQQKAKNKEQKENKTPQKEDTDEGDEVEIEEVVEVENESESLAKSKDKRHTVELKFVKIIPEEDDEDERIVQAEVHQENGVKKMKSPEEKRKSIVKVGGVPVMPGAMINEISKRSHRISAQYDRHNSHDTNENIISKVNDTIENLQAIECQIADFVGKKHGTQYNRIRDKLNNYLIELNQYNTNEDFVFEQVKLCKNFVSSCLNFLDEKAVVGDDFGSSDDVFAPENQNLVKEINAQIKLQKFSKTTAI